MVTALFRLGLIAVLCAVYANSGHADDDGSLERLEGTWQCTKYERAGEPAKNLQVAVTIAADKITFDLDREKSVATIRLDPTKSPKQLHWKQPFEFFDGKATVEFGGIYLAEGDTLMICLPGRSSRSRPVAFESTKENGNDLILLKRLKDKKQDAADWKAIQGKWQCTKYERSGRPASEYAVEFTIRGKQLSFKTEHETFNATIDLDASAVPKHVTWVEQVEIAQLEFDGIYILEGDTLLICLPRSEFPRPKSFESTEENGCSLIILKRIKDKK
jgi:uncharacterized protein (TIGR03067 family)